MLTYCDPKDNITNHFGARFLVGNNMLTFDPSPVIQFRYARTVTVATLRRKVSTFLHHCGMKGQVIDSALGAKAFLGGRLCACLYVTVTISAYNGMTPSSVAHTVQGLVVPDEPIYPC